MLDIYKLQNLQKYPHIKHGFSLKSDGNMSFLWGNKDEVVNNRQKFLQTVEIPFENCVMMTVQHGSNIKIVDFTHAGLGMNDLESALPVDALITNQKNLALCLQTADCLPILFYDPIKEVIALGHMGWLGTDKKLSQKIIQKMSEKFSCKSKDIIIGIGPGIHKGSYIFDNPVIQANDPNWYPHLEKENDNQTSVDTIGYNVTQLLESGIQKDHIKISPLDTAKDLNSFSHYRSVRTDEPEGRQMSVIELV